MPRVSVRVVGRTGGQSVTNLVALSDYEIPRDGEWEIARDRLVSTDIAAIMWPVLIYFTICVWCLRIPVIHDTMNSVSIVLYRL